MFKGKRKGFSVFTPMVGSIIILITFLVVASMLESEKWNFQGITESYQTIQMSGISQEAQARFVAAIRDSMLSSLEQMSVSVDQCRNDSIVNLINGKLAMSSSLPTCEEKALNATLGNANVTVRDLALSSSYIQALIRSITDKYSLVRVNPNICASCNVNGGTKKCTIWVPNKNNGLVEVTEKFYKSYGKWEYDGCYGQGGMIVKPGKKMGSGGNVYNCPMVGCVYPSAAIEKVRLLNCNGIENGQIDCQDGRIEVTANFSNLSNIPIAKILSKSGQQTELDIYLPNGEKKFITNDPLGYYVLVLSRLFQNFTLMDLTWHRVGGYKNHDSLTAYGSIGYSWKGYGNGSEWYHYKYAIQTRIPVSKEYVQGYNKSWNKHGENFDHTHNVTQTLYYKNSSGEPITLSGSGWRMDKVLNRQSYILNYFDIGVANIGSGTLPIFPGGTVINATVKCKRDYTTTCCCDQDGNPYTCTKTDIKNPSVDLPGKGNNLTNGKQKYEKTHFIAVNDTTSYDEKFFNDPKNCGLLSQQCKGPLSKATKEIGDHLNEPTLKVSAGYSSNDPVIVNVTVNSTQYYLCNKTTGGDNWYCGEWVSQYVPDTGEPYLTLMDILWNWKTKNCSYLCGKKHHWYIPSCTNLENGEGCDTIKLKQAWFLSKPYNFTCYTCTLYRVWERYKVTRNTHKGPDKVNDTVLDVVFTRYKENYGNPYSGKQKKTLALWLGSGSNSPNSKWINGDNIKKRIVLYSCQYKVGTSTPKCYMKLERDDVNSWIDLNLD